MGSYGDLDLVYDNRLYFDEPELSVCEWTEDEISQMSKEEQGKLLVDYQVKLREMYESNPERIKYANTMIKLAKSVGSIEYEGIGYFHLAVFFNATQKYYAHFKETIQQSITLLRSTKLYHVLAYSYVLLGADANNYGQYNLCLDYYLLAKQFAITSDNSYIKATVCYFFSGFYIMVGDLEKALEYGLKSVNYYEESVLESNQEFFATDGTNLAYCMLGQCYILKGQYEDAKKCYEKSKEREKHYTPRYDSPHTALIYAFHVMILHINSKKDQRNQTIDRFIENLKKFVPSPSFFLHIINLVYYLIGIGEYTYAEEINKVLIAYGCAKDNPNFGLYVSNMEIVISKQHGDEKRLLKALEHFYNFYIKNHTYVLENLRKSTELRIEIEDIQKAKNELQIAKAANEAKSNFLSNVSHEIRTPLNAILGMDEMILRETKDDEIYSYARDIKSAGDTLLGLINDILDSSKLDANKIKIMAVEYDIGSVINDMINIISQKAKNKGIEWKVEVSEDIPLLLYGDEIRMKQCVLNILSNALKYTEHGSVTLRVTSRNATAEEKSHVADVEYNDVRGESLNLYENQCRLYNERMCMLRFSVIDTGIGIKPEDIHKLEMPFERIEEERNRNIEGTGLGMSIVYRLLHMMGSKLEVESVYGEGSTFSFALVQGIRSDETIGDFSERYQKYHVKREDFQVDYVAPEARILIVDDTPANLTVAKGLLKPIGAKIDVTDSGKNAIEMIQNKAYDLLFIDHRMPGMDGVETLHVMKQLETNLSKDAPCIALTANVISGARELFLEEGFDDYLAKPIDSAKLMRMVKEYLPKERIQERIECVEQRMDIPYEDASKIEEELQILAKIPGMDSMLAWRSCGEDLDILHQTMQDFVAGARTQAEEIERYLLLGDIKNYTIQVHGLKSAARFIGALYLSEQAAYLEACGNALNVNELQLKTPVLLEDYKVMAEHIEEVLRELSGERDTSEVEDVDKPVADEAMLAEIYGGIREFVEAFDYPSAEGMIHLLEGYKIPDSDFEKVTTIKELLRNVDYEGLLKILK
ncbi:MAG: response regulator [Lachnospiraceae bacterium]|nr:response regulator [Lachnospiraceae bacterium]